MRVTIEQFAQLELRTALVKGGQSRQPAVPADDGYGDAPGRRGALVEFFDTHCHLGDRAFAADRDRVLERAWRAGVVGVLCVGYDVASSRAALSLATESDRIWAVVGVHPHDAARQRRDYIGQLRELARHPKVVAIGEAGLDFYRDLSPRPAQRDAFLRQVELAQELGLPLVVHDRDAHDETLEILTRAYPPAVSAPPSATLPAAPTVSTVPATQHAGAGVMHCFAGDTAMAEACLELGFHLSFAGPLTFPKADRARAVAAQTPLGRLLIETDCPYLAPQAHRGRRNEPAYVSEVAEALASVKGITLEEAAARTTANARQLFRLS